MAAEKELLQGIALMKEGKEEGFNILYSHTYNYVYSRARSVMKTESDAQDLTQETFIQAYKGIATLEDANNVYAWLGGIVFRQGAKLYNKTKKELLLNEDQDYIFEEVETKDVDALPEQSAEVKATTDVVMGMIDELPELQRSAVVSFYYDHLKIEEIAKVFDCSVNTIKSRLNYAKKFLKSKVEEHQKQYSYKLFSFSPAVLLLALRGLLSSEKYTMAPESAEKVYHVACDALGITASTVTVGAAAATAASSATAGTAATGAVAGTAALEGAAIGATATASAAGTATTVATATKAGGLIGKFLAMSTAAKTGAVVLATAVIGSGATTAVLVSNNNPEPPAIVQEVVIDEPEITMTPEPTSTVVPTATPIPTSEPTATPIPTSEPEYEPYTYEIHGEEIWITGLNKDVEHCIIPVQINGYPVTTIRSAAFAVHPNLRTIVFPDTITTIEHLAFTGSEKLESIVIPPKVVEIADHTFYGCFALSSVSLPDGLTKIGDLAFSQCSLSTIKLPDSLTFIGTRAFDFNEKLASIEIPDSVTHLGNFAFTDCYMLHSVKLPTGITSIPDETFRACWNLKNLVIPEGVTEVGRLSFGDCQSLRSLTLPNSLRKIGEMAFFKSEITELVIPEGVTYIGPHAFGDSTLLKDLTIARTVETIADRAFSHCRSLEHIVIPEGVKTIGAGAFQHTYPETIVLPTSVTNIGENAFIACEEATFYVTAGSYAETYVIENGFTYILQE